MQLTQRPGLRRGLLVVIAFIGFISLGLPDGILGVALPYIRQTFALPLDAFGGLLLMFAIGYMLSSFNSGRIVAWLGVGRLLVVSCALTGIALVGYATAPEWWIFMGFGVVSGLGAGAIDAGLNIYAASHFSPRSLNWLHGFYGVGATAGPLIMTAAIAGNGVSAGRWQNGYWIVAVMQIALAVLFIFTRSWWNEKPADGQPDVKAVAPTPVLQTLRIPIVWVGILIFFVYVSLEVSGGQWFFTLLTQSRQIDPVTAGTWVSLYYGSFTVGRFVIGGFANRVRTRALIAAGMIGALIGVGLIALGGRGSAGDVLISEGARAFDARLIRDVGTFGTLTLIGMITVGVSLAPVYPSLTVLTPIRLGDRHAPNAIGFQAASSMGGVAFTPALIGALGQRVGIEILIPFMAVLGVALLGLYIGLSLDVQRLAKGL